MRGAERSSKLPSTENRSKEIRATSSSIITRRSSSRAGRPTLRTRPITTGETWANKKEEGRFRGPFSVATQRIGLATLLAEHRFAADLGCPDDVVATGRRSEH